MKLNYLIFTLFLPLFLSCQENKITISNAEDIRVPIDLDVLKNRSWGFGTSAQFGQSGLGVFDLGAQQFYVQHKFGGAIDSFPVPEGHQSNFFNIVANPNGDYYFLDTNLGLYKLISSKPLFIDSINNNPVLRNDGLMIHNTINVFQQAQFKDKDHLIIPITWNYFNPKGKYKKFNKPVPRFCEYNLLTKEIKLIHCMTPQDAMKSDYNGMQFTYFGCVKGDSLIMSARYKSQMTLYSISQDKVIAAVDCKSAFETAPIAELGKFPKKKLGVEADRYEIETASYGPVVYNQERNEYYKVYYHSLPRKNEAGDYTIYTDKSSSVLVLDENLELKREIYFKDDNYIVLGMTCTSKGFIINSYDKKVGDKIYYYEMVL